MAAPDLASFNGNIELCAGDGTNTTNSIEASVNFTSVKLGKSAGGPMTIEVDFVSDGTIAVNGFTATTSATIVKGHSGQAYMWEGTSAQTTAAFSVWFNNWSASFDGDESSFDVFSDRYKRSSLGSFQLKGSASGFASTGQIMPVS